MATQDVFAALNDADREGEAAREGEGDALATMAHIASMEGGFAALPDVHLLLLRVSPRAPFPPAASPAV